MNEKLTFEFKCDRCGDENKVPFKRCYQEIRETTGYVDIEAGCETCGTVHGFIQKEY